MCHMNTGTRNTRTGLIDGASLQCMAALLGSNISLAVVDAIVADVVRALVGGNHAQVVTQVVLLQELLGEVLEVAVNSVSRAINGVHM